MGDYIARDRPVGHLNPVASVEYRGLKSGSDSNPQRHWFSRPAARLSLLTLDERCTLSCLRHQRLRGPAFILDAPQLIGALHAVAELKQRARDAADLVAALGLLDDDLKIARRKRARSPKDRFEK
jgi:hypothetical protein